MVDAQEEFADISNENYYDADFCMSGDTERDQKYVALYDKVRADLLEIKPKVSELVDILLEIYYTDKGFMKRYKDKSILWGCFGELLIERCKGNFNNDIDEKQLDRLGEVANAGKMDEVAKMIPKAKYDIPKPKEVTQNNQTINVTQDINVNCPNVTNTSGAEYLVKALRKASADVLVYNK